MKVIHLEDVPEITQRLGLILTSYGEIEYAVGKCVGDIIRDNIAGLKVLFRIRGQADRLAVCDAIMRPGFEKADLKDEYEAALGAARHAKKIRNQYAHAHWMAFDPEGVYFTDMDDSVQTASTDEIYHAMRHIDEPLLDRQVEFLTYTTVWFAYLHHEYCLRAGELSNHDWKAPKIREQPPLHNPIDQHPLPRRAIEAEPAPEELPPKDH